MFNQQELQILLGGVDTPIDLDDLRKQTQYGGLYDDHHLTIQLFWQVRSRSGVTSLRELTDPRRRQHVQSRAQEAAAIRDELQSAAITVSTSA